MFVLAHLSDPHLGPLPAPRLHHLAGKRLTGYVNWKRGRHRTHDMAVLEALLADLDQQHVDHVAFTGDAANLGLADEFALARTFTERLGSPRHVSFVPGNHDNYTRGSAGPMLRALGPWMANDGADGPAFPYVRRRDGVAIVGVSSAVPTLPFLASGRVGRRQRAALTDLLTALGREGLCRIVLIHHPPHPTGARPGRGLDDAHAFCRVIAEAGAEAILHGHNHRPSVAHIAGPSGPVPVIGVPSCSAWAEARHHRAAYHLLAIEPDGPHSRLHLRARGLLADGRTIAEVPAPSPG